MDKSTRLFQTTFKIIVQVGMEQLETRAKRIDVVPMVKYYMDQLDLYRLFQKYVPLPFNGTLAPAQVLCVMVSNIICASKPLYKVEEWLADYTDGLSEQPIEASLYNDDQLGRDLDRLFRADRHSLMTELSGNAIRVHGLETVRMHNDSTSISLQGEYDVAEDSAVKPMHGFNKDHRPDCKQVVFGLKITADGYVPLIFQLFDGNRTDDTTHKVNWNGLRTLLDKEDFIYIADCKLCSADNLRHIAGNGGKFITIVPKNRVDVKRFYKLIRTKDVQWVDAYTVENSRKKGELIVYRTYEGGLSQDGYRLVWVHSSTKAAQDKGRREHRISKAEEQLIALESKLNGYKLKTRDQIEAVVEKASKGVQELLDIQIVEQRQTARVQSKAGRPGPQTAYVEKDLVLYRLEWSRNREAIEEASRTDGIFPLITNTDIEASQVLRKYKEQPYLEKRMYTTKSILQVAPVFLQLPRRIEAITFLYFVALMIISLMERNIRRNMAQASIDRLPILPQGMNTKKPTWNNMRYFFRNVHLAVIEQGETVIQTIVKGLTELHTKILLLLEIPSRVYTELKERWWEFETTWFDSS